MRLVLASLVLVLGSTVDGFCPSVQKNAGVVVGWQHAVGSPLHVASTGAGSDDSSSFLLDEFKTTTGEILDPYAVLKVSRTAERKEIREAYKKLSRRYHPDGARHRDILPGSCNNHDDIRDEWERIKLAYEILSDKRTRMRYDRHSTIADPGAAMKRAALDAVGWGLKGVSDGIFQAGAGAWNALTTNDKKNSSD